MGTTLDVRAAIRYGRRSGGQDCTYTMVFSRGCVPGRAKVVRCRRDVETGADLVGEAMLLWGAERKREPNGRIAAGWGCVALLVNPGREAPTAILDTWAERVACEAVYGNVPQLPEEGTLVSAEGLLNIGWPAIIGTGEAVPLDLLLATATHPSLEGEPLSYPSPRQIASAARDNRDYFGCNVRAGIATFEDDAISALRREAT